MMFESLSPTQKQIVFDKQGKFVVRACPGSGKTYSVSARIAKRISGWKNPNTGIAAISFTNVAWEEISKQLSYKFRIPGAVYPHFLGTIDSFINNYIFLPYGHLVMGCGKRPELVGSPHSSWSIKRYDKDYHQYFDIVSFDERDKLTYPEIQGKFYFGFNAVYKNNGEESQHAVHLRRMKSIYWLSGYATQHDANYFALKILEKYPNIAKSIAHRFSEIILDEAQDTNNIHMRILDILVASGLSEVMFVGDPDQAIFEWNKAKPKLFQSKFEEWKENSVVLNENRRSSRKICGATYHLSTLEKISDSIDESVSDFNCDPEVVVFDSANVQATIELFKSKCINYGIDVNHRDVAIICRSKSFVNEILGNPLGTDLEWTSDYKFTYPYLHAAFLFSNGLVKKSFKILETVILKIHGGKEIINKADVDLHISKVGIIAHRTTLFNIFKRLPKATGLLGAWVDQVNQINGQGMHLLINDGGRNVEIERLFSLAEEELPFLEFKTGTVHSVKGETFEAILLFLKTKGAGRNYTTLLRENVSPEDDEELRIVYVGMTRPRKLLMLAVPNLANKIAWERKLNINMQ